MENLPAIPTATARVFLRRTKDGSVIKVRLSTPAGLTWRSYRLPLGLYDAVSAALRSAQISAAYTQLALPIHGNSGKGK